MQATTTNIQRTAQAALVRTNTLANGQKLPNAKADKTKLSHSQSLNRFLEAHSDCV